VAGEPEPIAADVPGEDRAPLYQLAYQESQRNLTQQAAVLDNLRTRAGLILTAANVITALLGAPAIKNATTPVAGGAAPGLSLGGWLAVAAFAVVGVASIVILWPWKGWTFSFDIKKMVKLLDNNPDVTLAETYQRLALENEKSVDDNGKKLHYLFLALEAAAFALFLEAVFWVFALTGTKIAGIQF